MATKAEQAKSAAQRKGMAGKPTAVKKAAAKKAKPSKPVPRTPDKRALREKRDTNLNLREERVKGSPENRARKAIAKRTRVRPGGA